MKNDEKGRSMIEMLGVLALIGILSITGIYTYTIAMRRYRANEIAQTASMLAIMARAADHGSGECLILSDTNLPQNPGGTANLYMEADATKGDTVTINIEITDDSLQGVLEDLLSETPDISINGPKFCGE